jgi:hypothetical protein
VESILAAFLFRELVAYKRFCLEYPLCANPENGLKLSVTCVTNNPVEKAHIRSRAGIVSRSAEGF